MFAKFSSQTWPKLAVKTSKFYYKVEMKVKTSFYYQLQSFSNFNQKLQVFEQVEVFEKVHKFQVFPELEASSVSRT